MSIRLCAVVTLGETSSDSLVSDVVEALNGAAARVGEIQLSHAGEHLPGSFGAGDLTWDFVASDASALESLKRRAQSQGTGALLGALGEEQVTAARCSFYAAALETIDASVPQPTAFGIKRTNLVRVRPGTPSASIDQWAREVTVLADHVPAIRNWSLSRVCELIGDAPPAVWTHAWEQDFETLEGLTEDYMMSPYHWGHLDGWYDPEVPWSIVEPELAHLFCPARQSVLSWSTRVSEGTTP